MRYAKGSEETEFWFREGCFITEWSNSQVDPELSVARARVPVGTTTRWHRLADTIERYVIIEGAGRAEIGEAPPVDVAPGDVLRIEAGEPQRITNTGDTDLVFLAICAPPFKPENYSEIPELENEA